VLALAVTGVVAAALPHVVQYLDAELRRAFALAIRQRLSAAMGRVQGLARHEDKEFHKRLTDAAEAGPSGPVEVLTNTLGVLQGMATVAAFVGTLGVINPWMLLIVLAAAVPTLRAELVLSRARAQTLARLVATAERERVYARLMVSLEAAKEVRLYGLEGLFAGRMIAEMRRVDAGHRIADRRELLVQVLLGGVGAAIAGGGLFWAGSAASVGALSVGDVSVFVAAIAGVQAAMVVAIAGWGQTYHALLLFGHVWAVMNVEPDLPEGPRRPVPELYTGIEFQDVWFRYADHLPWVLRGASFTLRAGCTTAMVGRNGSGKSTVVKLLCRFYDPTHGSIRWDGVDLREFDVDDLRRRIGAVFQDFMRYELSAAENIAVGDVNSLYDRPRVRDAASWAGVYPTLAGLPRGFDTLLTPVEVTGEPGDDAGAVALSGGQWQRVALARAMFRRGNSVVILDEPSSGLDPQAEHELHQRLRELRAGRTSLLISHRLNTVRDADAVVVLAGGSVVESGTHRDLVSRGGRYADLFNLQAIGYQP
jgi:ATP-binding cassette subfamily B protein